MATQIVVTTTTVAELKEILQDMCGSGQAQVITVGDKVAAVKPEVKVAIDTAIADKAAAEAAAKAKADADAKAAAADKAAKAKAEKLAKLKAEAAALEAGEEPVPEPEVKTEPTKTPTVDEFRATVKARIAELKGSTRPNVVGDISGWKTKTGAPSLADMDMATLEKLLAFINS